MLGHYNNGIPVVRVFSDFNMTYLDKWSIKLINLGPKAESKCDAATLGKVLPSSF